MSKTTKKSEQEETKGAPEYSGPKKGDIVLFKHPATGEVHPAMVLHGAPAHKKPTPDEENPKKSKLVDYPESCDLEVFGIEGARRVVRGATEGEDVGQYQKRA